MTVETATYISQLNPAYPAAGDARSEGDDHIRLNKAVLQNQFTNLGAAAVTVTAAQINVLAKSPYAVLLATASASASATIDFTTGIDSTYEEYELHIINAIPATNTDLPWLRTSSDAGSNWASASGDYEYQIARSTGTAMTVSNGAGTATKFVLADTAPTVSPLNGVVRFFDPASTAAVKQFSWDLAYINAAGGGTGGVRIIASGRRNVTGSAVNGIRFMFSTGNITSGKFKLYGVSKA